MIHQLPRVQYSLLIQFTDTLNKSFF